MSKVLIVLMLVSGSALAQINPAQIRLPCNPSTNGQVLINPRSPTQAEITSSAASRPLNAPELLMQQEHITCNGANGAWELTTTVPQYRGGSQ